MAGQDTLPIYQNASSSPSSASSISTYTTTAKDFVVGVSESGKAVLARQRPWSEVFDRNYFAKPDSVADATNRMKKNLSYFRVNYAVLATVVLGIGLLWHPGSLIILLALTAAWIFLYFSRSEPVVLFDRSYSEREVLIVLGVITFVVIFLTSTGSTIFMGLAMAAALVAVHAALRTPDDLFLEEPDNVSGSFLSFQPQPHVSSRV